MDKILVLLSSYNGEKYLEEQIDSILAQEDVKVHLLVRDDGSKDSTVQILEKYKNKGSLDFYSGENMGWQRSFMHLVATAPSFDYYAFSDQDDYWKPNKLKVAIRQLKKMPIAVPNLYMSNLIYWKNGNELGMTLPSAIRTDAYHSLLFCESFGCTMVFNNSLMQLIQTRLPEIKVSHDFWFVQVASLMGNIHYDKDAYILYRQHGDNQLGADKFFTERWKNRFDGYIKLFKTHRLDIQAKELIRCYGEAMSSDNQRIVECVANYRECFKDYLKLLFSSKYTHDRWLTNIGLKFRILVRHI